MSLQSKAAKPQVHAGSNASPQRRRVTARALLVCSLTVAALAMLEYIISPRVALLQNHVPLPSMQRSVWMLEYDLKQGGITASDLKSCDKAFISRYFDPHISTMDRANMLKAFVTEVLYHSSVPADTQARLNPMPSTGWRWAMAAFWRVVACVPGPLAYVQQCCGDDMRMICADLRRELARPKLLAA